MKEFEICREVFDLSWQIVERDPQHKVLNHDLVRIRDRAPQTRMCPEKQMRSVSLLKTYWTICFKELLTAKHS